MTWKCGRPISLWAVWIHDFAAPFRFSVRRCQDRREEQSGEPSDFGPSTVALQSCWCFRLQNIAGSRTENGSLKCSQQGQGHASIVPSQGLSVQHASVTKQTLRVAGRRGEKGIVIRKVAPAAHARATLFMSGAVETAAPILRTEGDGANKGSDSTIWYQYQRVAPKSKSSLVITVPLRFCYIASRNNTSAPQRMR